MLGSWCRGNQEGSFCTCSGCLDLQSVHPAVEKKHLLMSLLCISSVLTVGPGCWGKQSYSWVAPQPLSTRATTCGCPLGITHLREHPRVCRTVSLETAYPICKHSTMIIHLIERNSWKWLKSLLVGQSQPLCQTPPTVPSATILPKRARVCVCAHIKILAKVVNDRITNFMKLKAPRRPAGAFPKPGNQTAGLSTLSSAPTAAHVARFWQQTPGSRDASEIPRGSRCSWNGVFVWYTCEVCVSHKIQRMWLF